MNSSADRYAVTVPFKDGTKKAIKFDANALATLEEMLGVDSAVDLLPTPGNPRALGFRTIRAFIWVGTRAAGGRLEVEDVGDQMDLTNFKAYVEGIAKAVSLALTGKLPEISSDDAEEVKPIPPVKAPAASSGIGIV
jgi:hypothetical protein